MQGCVVLQGMRNENPDYWQKEKRNTIKLTKETKTDLNFFFRLNFRNNSYIVFYYYYYFYFNGTFSAAKFKWSTFSKISQRFQFQINYRFFENKMTKILQDPVSSRSPHLSIMSLCLFVLRFYGPVNPMGSCRARSVYLTTRLLGRLSPLSG